MRKTRRAQVQWRSEGANVRDGVSSHPVKTVLAMAAHPVKPILAIAAGSRDADSWIESGPGACRKVQQREMLQDYSRNLRDLLPRHYAGTVRQL